MSFCRSPYYVFGTVDKIQFYKDSVCQGSIDYEGIGQFLVNLINRAQTSFSCKIVLNLIRKGLACERKSYYEGKKNDWLGEDDKMMTKKDIVKSLRKLAMILEKEIRREKGK